MLREGGGGFLLYLPMDNPEFIKHYNKNLRGFAKEHRTEGTKAEAALWKYVLRARMMKGYQFNRQRSVLNFIADFMCKPLSLIIEVDGITHNDNVAGDYVKTKLLEDAGFIVLRFKDDDVLRNIDFVKREIESVIEKLENNK
jgi:very-short-patch-repair endonuclease